MKQKIVDMGFGAMIELEIDNREVFSEDFKQYAKMVYLGTITKAGMPNAMDISNDGISFGGTPDGKNHEKVLAEIATRLCGVAARAVAEQIAEITKELSDGDKLNESLKDLFGDFWDEENKRFKKGLQ